MEIPLDCRFKFWAEILANTCGSKIHLAQVFLQRTFSLCDSVPDPKTSHDQHDASTFRNTTMMAEFPPRRFFHRAQARW